MKVKVSDFIVEYIAQLGVKHVFVVSGGGNLHLIDSIRKNPNLEYVPTHHEQSASMAAEAYARVNENLGVCCVTFGPASTNTITGVFGAWTDSIPVLYISGQVRREHMKVGGLRQLGVQEVDIIEMVSSITKYAVTVKNPEDILYHLSYAIFAAKSGRPGPVYLDIPGDVQSAYLDTDKLDGAYFDDMRQRDCHTNEVVHLLRGARRPVLFVGHGISLAKGRSELDTLIRQLNMPVATSMLGHDLISSDHPLNIGRPGVFGDRAGNLAVQNADLILSIGVRHGFWNIGYDGRFGKHAVKIVVDIDFEELHKKTYPADLRIQADAYQFISQLNDKLVEAEPLPDWGTWVHECQGWRKKYPVVLPEYAEQTDYVNSYHFTRVLEGLMSPNEIIVTGVGTSFTGTLQSLKLRHQQRLHSNVGCAAMGYDLPASIGACFAANRQRIVLLTGDGSIMMNLQELQIIKHHNLPVKIFLFNNAGYLAIKNTQNTYFGGELAAVDQDTGVSFPDFRKVCKAFEIEYLKVENHQDGMEHKIRYALDTNGPILVDLTMSSEQPLWPKLHGDELPDGSIKVRGLEDMSPLLPRDEFEHNMRHVLDLDKQVT